MDKIKELYRLRFNARDLEIKEGLWRVLCSQFLQKYVKNDDVLLDLGAGYCEFINNIRCGNKIAIDINPESKKFCAPDVSFFIANSSNMSCIPDDSIDVVFTSELLEHLKNQEELFGTLDEAYRVLKPGGRLIIICPNIRFLAGSYWDFIDHRLALSDASVKESLLLHKFAIINIIPRFLPFTIKNRLPKSEFLLSVYLKMPIIWNFFGKQMFIVAKK